MVEPQRGRLWRKKRSFACSLCLKCLVIFENAAAAAPPPDHATHSPRLPFLCYTSFLLVVSLTSAPVLPSVSAVSRLVLLSALLVTLVSVVLRSSPRCVFVVQVSAAAALRDTTPPAYELTSVSPLFPPALRRYDPDPYLC